MMLSVLRVLTCGGFNHVRFTLELFDDGVDLDNVGNTRSQTCDEVGILGVGNLNLGYSRLIGSF